jgi:polysaccharide biosynthesis/export protein
MPCSRRLRHSATITLFSWLVCFAASGFAQTTASSQNAAVANHAVAGSMSATDSTKDAPPAPNWPHYKITPGDTLDVTVFGAPDLSQKARVTSTGDIYLPLVDYVHVAGLDVEEAQTAIEKALKKGNFLTAPHVTVAVAEYADGVLLMGEVVKPGIYPITGSNGRLLDVLTQAGGTTPNAAQLVSITHRGDPQPETVYLSHDPEKAMEANVPVHQGDAIMVAKAGMIFVVGEVVQPSAFVMESRSGYTALKAVAMAHGATRLAKLSRAVIVRQTATGVEQIPVPLDKIAESKAPDTELIADDILMVPTSHAKIAAAQAMSMAQSIAVFGAATRW